MSITGDGGMIPRLGIVGSVKKEVPAFAKESSSLFISMRHFCQYLAKKLMKLKTSYPTLVLSTNKARTY